MECVIHTKIPEATKKTMKSPRAIPRLLALH